LHDEIIVLVLGFSGSRVLRFSGSQVLRFSGSRVLRFMQKDAARFVVQSGVVWIVMIVVLILVPDALEDWMSLTVARVCGWVLASGIWVAVVEREWRARFSPIPRFLLQTAIWLSAALIAIYISDYFRMGRGQLL
jgi:hypothetical protein